jgi:two-component system, OmpR family, sensor histidine kinase KdpD
VKQAAGLDESRAVCNRQAAWLRVYLGYAPGVGKTYAMLHDGRRRRSRGTDVVVGWVHTYNRPHTLAAIDDLEIVPSRVVEYRGQLLQEMDIDAVIARRPQVALVDELAHTNVPGSKHIKRYEDVFDLRENGINVITTVNVQHLASLQDTVQLLAGVTVTETLPDWVLDAADELEMIDQSPDALRKRLRRGNVQPKEQVERALGGFFRIDTLTALRELTLRQMALHAERKPPESRDVDPFSVPGRSAETVLVGVLRGDEAQILVRRGVHLADRLRGRLLVLHISQPGSSFQADTSGGHQETVKALQLARALGAEVHTVVAYSSVSDTLVRFASDVRASQIVLGESAHSWWRELIGGSIVRDVLRRTRDVDIHIVRRAER